MRVATIVVAAALVATRAAATPEGGTESNLGLGAGSRAIALGGACTARLDDASALFWNPAGLGRLARGDLAIMHAPIGYGDAAQTFVGIAWPTVSAGSFGLGYLRLGTGGIQAFDAASQPQGEVEYVESSLLLAYAFRPALASLGRNVAIGLTGKTLTQSIGTLSSTSVGLDVGVTVAPQSLPSLALAATWRDAIAPRPRLDLDADPIPSTLQLAGSFSPGALRRLGVALHLGFDRTAALGWSPRAGLECSVRNRLHLRLGASRHGAAFGVGVGWSQYALDYAYVGQAGAATHPVSLGAHFGRSVPERVAARSAARERDLRLHLQTLLEARLASAQAAYDRGDYAAALDEWKVVAGLDPAEERAQHGLEAASTALAAAQARSSADRDAAAGREALFAVALEHYTRNDYRTARTVWTELLEADPQNAEARRYLDKTDEALRRQVRQLGTGARAQERAGDWIEALAGWTAVRHLDPQNTAAASGIERCRTALARPAAAPAARAAAPDPQYQEALDLFAQGSTERAVALLREVRRKDPKNEAAAKLLARAERQSKPLSSDDRARVRDLYLRGMSYFTSNEFERAIAEWTKILSIDPANTSIYQNIEDARARLRALAE